MLSVKLAGFLCWVSVGFVLGIDRIDNAHYRCLNTTTHKRQPGPETDLHKQCSPWKERSCCTDDLARKIHNLDIHRFNFNHCPKNLSAECKKYFVQDLCFFECSPNLGPWIQKVKMKVRSERMFGVPLCRSECQAWFSACADDFTCSDNWVRNFNWGADGNKCMAKCATFRQVFATAQRFCQDVWDGSWEVVNDSEPCMKMSFDPADGNPNDNIAMRFYQLNLAEADEPSHNGAHRLASLLFFVHITAFSLVYGL